MVISCRLCLAQYSKEKLSNIFTCNIKHSSDSLVDLLFWVFAVEVDVTDQYTKDICEECLLLIEYVVEIRNTFQKNQKTLRQNENVMVCEELETQSLDTIKESKFCQKDVENWSERCNTPTGSTSKYSYGTSSPRVRVTLATLEAMCPLMVQIDKLETSSEYMQYRKFRNGRFRKRSYRHFNIDCNLLDDICSTLDDKKQFKTEILKKDIDISAHSSMVSKAVNTDESCFSNSVSPWSWGHFEALPLLNLSNDKNKKNENDSDESLMDIIKITKDISSTISSPQVEKDYDWTRVTFKKDKSTSTEPESLSPSKTIGINVQVDTVDVGTLTKRLKQIKNKNVVKINVQSLDTFSPKVWLEPVDYLLGRDNYIQINDFCYRKDDRVKEHEQESVSEECDQSYTESRRDIMALKKQRFLDYYNNFSSFAVRELIAGKKIRDSESETSPIFKVSNVCNVLVCNFCSKSFLTQTMLNLHCKRAHRSIDITNLTSDSVTPSDMPVRKKFLLRKTRKRRSRQPGLKKYTPSVKNCTSQGVSNSEKHIETSNNISARIPEQPSGLVNSTDLLEDSNNRNSKSITRNHSLDLRKKSHSTNYNINSIIRTQTRLCKAFPTKVNGKTRGGRGLKRRRLRKREGIVVKTDDAKDTSYIWDRKSLGTYSAITFYKKKEDIAEDTVPALDLKQSDMDKKQDLALNETIRKLTNRLDGLEDLKSVDTVSSDICSNNL